MRVLLVALITLLAAAPAGAQVQVHVDIGFHLPAPPHLVVVPQVPAVQYVPAPAAPGNLFLYAGQYWAFTDGGWYVSSGYDGPWIAVAPQFVPRPVLLVPVRYYHVPPGHWKKWDRGRPPHWHEEWGRQWADHREWKSRESRASDHGHDHAGPRAKEHGDKGHGHGRGH
jgi:hypothetical protein